MITGDQEASALKDLHEKLLQLAEETGHSYEMVLLCAIDMCNSLLREANLRGN